MLRLHEDLVRLHAYPPDPDTLRQVRAALERFARRRDLARYRDSLDNSGIAGTAIRYPFYWPTAHWLVRRWPDRITIDWDRFPNAERLVDYLYLVLPFTESVALDDLVMEPADWLEALAGPGETDAAFLVRRFAAVPVMDPWRERVYEDLAVPLVVAPGPDTPSRTTTRFPVGRVHYQAGPLARTRPDLGKEIVRAPRSHVPVRGARAQLLIDMAREAMVTRSRDLDVFVNADPADVSLVDDGDGLTFACMGQRLERRQVLETVYGFLILKNGVPLGYVLNTTLFHTSEVALNIFDTFRGGETAHIYGRVLATLRYLFHSDVIVVPPYQLGHDNEEGLESGAWWFYYKLGFRPVDPGVRRLVRRELRIMRRRPRHRTSVAVLNELSAENMYWYLGPERSDVFGRVVLGRVGLAVSDYLAERFGAERERGLQVCAAEAARLLHVKSRRGWGRGERLAWGRWAPLVLCLPGVRRWPTGDRRALVAVIRAKGGKRELEYTRLFDGHARLRAAIVELQR